MFNITELLKDEISVWERLKNCGKPVVLYGMGDGADKVLAAMKNHELGTDAAVIGEVTERYPGKLTLRTAFGGSRVLQKLSGAQLPRIC